MRVIALVGSVFAATIAILVICMGSAAIRRHHPTSPNGSVLWWGKEIIPVLTIAMFVVAGIACVLI